MQDFPLSWALTEFSAQHYHLQQVVLTLPFPCWPEVRTGQSEQVRERGRDIDQDQLSFSWILKSVSPWAIQLWKPPSSSLASSESSIDCLSVICRVSLMFSLCLLHCLSCIFHLLWLKLYISLNYHFQAFFKSSPHQIKLFLPWAYHSS